MALQGEALLARRVIGSVWRHSVWKQTEVLGACSSSYADTIGRESQDRASRTGEAPSVSSCREVHTGSLHAHRGCWSQGIARGEGGFGSRVGLKMGLGQFGFQQQVRTMVLGYGDGDEDKDLARHHQEQRIIGYPPEQLFDVVAAVDFYEDFVPWCQRSEILMRKQEGPVEEVEAELAVGFKLFSESYTSHVTQERPRYVRSTVSNSNLFEYLDCLWEFNSGPTPNKTALKFRVDFQFRSPLYHRVANLFFDEVAARMVSSFERRCEQVYGPPVQDPVVMNTTDH